MIGHIDLFENGLLHGWHRSVFDALIVEIDDRFVGLANERFERSDVEAAGFGSGRTGFSFSVPLQYCDGRSHKIVVRASTPDSAVERTLELELREQPAQGTRAAVVCWDLAHNPAGRAFVLVRALQKIFDHVDLIGPFNARFGRSLWAPLKDEPDLSVVAEPVSTLHDLERLSRRINRTRYDFVHICKPRWSGLYLGWRLARASGCRVMLDIDDRELSFFPPGAERTTVDPTRFLADVRAGRAVPFDAEGTALSETLVRCFPRTVSSIALQERFGGAIVRHARSSTAFDPARIDRDAVRAELGYGPGDKVVSFVGTIRRHKGVLSIAEAIAQIGDPAIKLCLVGPIDDPTLRARMKELLGDAVSFYDGVPFSQLPLVVAAADLVCLPQDVASPAAAYQTPAKLTDALAMGVPAILEDLPPFRDLRGLAGIVLRDGRPLAEQMAEVLAAPPSRAAVRDTFLRHFSTEVVAEQMEQITLQARPIAPAAAAALDAAFDLRSNGASVVATGGANNGVAFEPSAPALLRRKGRDIVFLWKQNDSGVFGRRSDMIAKYLPLVGGAGRVLHFDASITLTALKRHQDRATSELTADGLILRNIIGRWLGLQDDLFVRRRTFIHDELGRNFMGRALPRREDLPDLFRQQFKADGLSEEALLWVFPVALDFPAVQKAWSFSHLVADLVDDQRAFDSHADHKRVLQTNYEQVLGAADTLFANCAGVAERFADLARSQPHIVSNAAEHLRIDVTERIDLFPGQDVVRIGYVGNLRDRFDAALIARLARARPDYRIILVGPTGGNPEVEALARISNITLTGPIQYENANRIAAGFDVAVLPHLQNALTETMNPLKLYLYQVLGLPVVATPVGNLDHAGPGVHISEDDDHFIRLVGELADQRARSGPLLATGPFWEDRARRIARVLDEAAPASDALSFPNLQSEAQSA